MMTMQECEVLIRYCEAMHDERGDRRVREGDKIIVTERKRCVWYCSASAITMVP